MRLNHRGLSLIEMMIVFTLISVMMVLSLPMLSTANEHARSELCQQNLVEISQTIAQHTQDTGQLPTLHNLTPTQDGISLPEFIQVQLHTPNVLFCPSDETEKSQLLETSYQWSIAFNNKTPNELTQHLGQRILADRETYHQNTALNINEIIIEQDQSGLRLGLQGDQSLRNSSGTRAVYLRPQDNRPQQPIQSQRGRDDHQDDQDEDEGEDED